jgi:iodotyrosine deiodinase
MIVNPGIAAAAYTVDGCSSSRGPHITLPLHHSDRGVTRWCKKSCMTAVFEPLRFTRREPAEMLRRAKDFYAELEQRRTTRHFSTDPVPRELIELAVAAAGTAPSGAHRQPWRFIAIDDPDLKAQIRSAAEREEHENYHGRMPKEWLDALAPLGTDEHKAHITDAPWLVVVFKESYEVQPDGSRAKNYYVDESVGIACGLFIAAIHRMGLCTLTHTPSPMAFLSALLRRPGNEKPFLVMPVGYPAADAQVPAIRRKPVTDILQWNLGAS